MWLVKSQGTRWMNWLLHWFSSHLQNLRCILKTKYWKAEVCVESCLGHWSGRPSVLRVSLNFRRYQDTLFSTSVVFLLGLVLLLLLHKHEALQIRIPKPLAPNISQHLNHNHPQKSSSTDMFFPNISIWEWREARQGYRVGIKKIYIIRYTMQENGSLDYLERFKITEVLHFHVHTIFLKTPERSIIVDTKESLHPLIVVNTTT